MIPKSNIARLGILLFLFVGVRIAFLAIRVNSFPPISKSDLPGVYLANHKGPPDRLLIKSDNTFILRYSDQSGRATEVAGWWSFNNANAHDPRMSFKDLMPGRSPVPRGSPNSPIHSGWPHAHPGMYTVQLARDKISGQIYMEINPDLGDYYEKQY